MTTGLLASRHRGWWQVIIVVFSAGCLAAQVRSLQGDVQALDRRLASVERILMGGTE